MKARLFALVALVALAAAVLPAAKASRTAQGLADAPWPMFHRDVQHTGRSTLLGPMSPVLKWRYATGGPVMSSPAIAADGTIYVGSNDGYLYALNPGGGLGWRYATGGEVESSPAIASDGTIYVGSSDSHLYALNPNGTLKWRFATVGRVRSSPAIAADGTIYVGADAIVGEDAEGGAILGGDDPYLYAIHPDGTLKWFYDVSSFPRYEAYSSPAIATDGTVYVGTPTGELLAVNPDGTLRWLSWYVSMPLRSSPAVAADGRIWIGCEFKGYLIRFGPNGSGLGLGQIWYGADVTSSPAIGADGTIYYGVDDRGAGYPWSTGYLAALDPNAFPDDCPDWSYKAGSAVDSSPAVGADGTVYVGSQDTYIYAVDANGTLKWRYKTGGGVYSSPAIGPDCMLYVGSDDGYLYAIQNGLSLQYGVEGYTGSEDTHIYQYATASNYCTQNQFSVGYKQQYAALLQFDLSEIPAGAVVSDGQLELYATGWSGTNMTIDAFRVLRGVQLCQTTWNQARSGENWATPGGNNTASDRAASPESSVATSGPRAWYRWTLTDLVQDWVDGSVTNNGVLLRGALPYSTSRFYFASNQTGDSSQRPRLIVRYCLTGPPPPTRTPTPTPAECVPSLISPAPGAVLDNGRSDLQDEIVWDFDWSDCPGAHYHLYVIGGNATIPVISDEAITSSSYHYVIIAYIIDANRFDWTWKVRAEVGGQWGPWSEVRGFDVEPLNTDQPPMTLTPTPLPPQGTVTLQYGFDGYTGSEDTYLYRYAATTNYCLRNQFQVGYKQQSAALLRFQLPATIPAGATISEARLYVYATGWSGANQTMSAFRVLRPNNIFQATWNLAWQGDAWGLPGCSDTATDRGATREDYCVTSGPRQWYAFNVTGLVQAWVNGSLPNNGILLRGDSATSTSLFYFASNEGDTVSEHPKLVIVYH